MSIFEGEIAFGTFVTAKGPIIVYDHQKGLIGSYRTKWHGEQALGLYAARVFNETGQVPLVDCLHWDNYGGWLPFNVERSDLYFAVVRNPELALWLHTTKPSFKCIQRVENADDMTLATGYALSGSFEEIDKIIEINDCDYWPKNDMAQSEFIRETAWLKVFKHMQESLSRVPTTNTKVHAVLQQTLEKHLKSTEIEDGGDQEAIDLSSVTIEHGYVVVVDSTFDDGVSRSGVVTCLDGWYTEGFDRMPVFSVGRFEPDPFGPTEDFEGVSSDLVEYQEKVDRGLFKVESDAQIVLLLLKKSAHVEHGVVRRAHRVLDGLYIDE